MRSQDYEHLYGTEDTYWWFAGMRRIHGALLGPADSQPMLLDAGCGTGANLLHFRKLGFRPVGVDLSPHAFRWLRQRGLDSLTRASISELPFPDRTFDVVTSLDVLCMVPVEQVPHALHEMRRVLKAGGVLLIRVPAFKWLWSSADESILSVQRFSRAELVALLREAGYEVTLASYANAFLFPVAAAWRLFRRLWGEGDTDVRPLPRGLRWLNAVFFRILVAEAWWLERGVRFPAGLSVIARARNS